MAKSKRRIKQHSRTKSINAKVRTVTVNVPKAVARKIPRKLYAPPALQRQRERSHIRVPIPSLQAIGPTVRKTVTVVLPNNNTVKPTQTLLRRDRITHFSRRHVDRHLHYEMHRQRNDERKHRRRRDSDPYIGSISHDRYGIISANRDARKLGDAALINAALSGKLK